MGKASRRKKSKGTTEAKELTPQRVTEISDAIKALNLPAESTLKVRHCDCKLNTLFLDQAARKLDRGLVRQIAALAERFGLSFSTRMTCPRCSRAVGGESRREIIHTGQSTVDREIPLAIANPEA